MHHVKVLSPHVSYYTVSYNTLTHSLTHSVTHSVTQSPTLTLSHWWLTRSLTQSLSAPAQTALPTSLPPSLSVSFTSPSLTHQPTDIDFIYSPFSSPLTATIPLNSLLYSCRNDIAASTAGEEADREDEVAGGRFCCSLLPLSLTASIKSVSTHSRLLALTSSRSLSSSSPCLSSTPSIVLLEPAKTLERRESPTVEGMRNATRLSWNGRQQGHSSRLMVPGWPLECSTLACNVCLISDLCCARKVCAFKLRNVKMVLAAGTSSKSTVSDENPN